MAKNLFRIMKCTKLMDKEAYTEVCKVNKNIIAEGFYEYNLYRGYLSIILHKY